MNHDSPNLLPNWRASRVALATVFVVSVGIAFWLVFRFRLVLFALFVALVISTAITPGVTWLNKRGVPRALGVILIYLLILALFAAFIGLVAPLILDQVTGISEELPVYYQQFRNWLLDSRSFLVRIIGARLPEELVLTPFSGQTPMIDPGDPGEPETRPDEAIREQISQAINYAGTLTRGIFLGMAVILLAFYWTLDGQRAVRYLLLLVPQTQREDIREIYEEVENKVGSYIRGVVLVSIIVGSMAMVAYWIVGLPYALSLGIIAGVFEAIPIVGPALGAIPAITIALGTGNNSIVIGVIVATMLIQAVENYILAPRILGHSVGVNPIVTLLALVTFTSLLGFAGALLAIPLAAVFQIILDRVLLNPETLEEEIPQGRDQLSVLRVELQELSTDVRKKIRQKDNETGESEDQVEDYLEKIAADLDQVLVDASRRSNANRGGTL
jgi:predicted PurR-regulated permease PerM